MIWLILIILILVLWIIFSYNSFVSLYNQAKEAWADIEVQLKRRYDLIPNLIETVKGYAAHEKDLFEKVTEARTKAISAQTMKDHVEAENFLSETLKSLFAVSENYPQLKASENFLELQRELRDTEDKIQAARRFYNSNVRDLNIKIEKFPTNIIAKIFKFKKMEFFETKEDKENEPVKVSF
ncbi:MAG TPA: LemA family protein [Candidatus Pacearchaeota archaeon]|nr:LemA family protein [Candidatus Pacearchaeota archaeon]HOW12915.1 LemA family protein [Candidatus Pacearchaeota archaeon]HPO68415.1 LemA family protein [Candidatus Pacearchaeota archaeon]